MNSAAEVSLRLERRVEAIDELGKYPASGSLIDLPESAV